MNVKRAALWSSIVILTLLAGGLAIRAQTGANSDTIALITKIENDSVKADLAGDKAFYQKLLADDATSGTSEGKWYTKGEMLKMFDDPKNNNTKSETLSDLKVRVYGNTVVATYTDTFDAMVMGQHKAKSVIATDTFAKIGGEWKGVANHSSSVK